LRTFSSITYPYPLIVSGPLYPLSPPCITHLYMSSSMTPWLPDMVMLLATYVALETLGIPPRGVKKRVVQTQEFNMRPTMQPKIMNQILLTVSRELWRKCKTLLV